MRKSMRMLALVLSFVMVLGLFPVVHAENAPVLANADDIVVYYTNDVHTYIDKALSYDNLADLKTETAKQAAGVLLVDAGDAVQGTAYGSMDKGKSIIDLMNAAGYDLATLGNHEFDYGMDGCMNVIEWANFPYVSANFYHEENGVVGETVLDAYKVFEVGGKKIAFIGVTTPESFTKSTPAYFQDENGNYIYGIAGGTDGEALYAAVQNAIDAASQEADLVIGLVHLGDDLSSQPWTSEEMIANTTGLDAVIDGHSHSTVPMKEVTDEGGNTVILTQTGEYFGAIGKMTISADGKLKTELVTEWAGSNADVKAIKDAWMTSVDTQLGEIIGTAEVTLDNYDAEGNRLVRTQETNTGDFCADALYYLFDNMDMDVDFAIMNGGGVRNKAITGELSYKTCKDIHTFGNVACLQTITGQQIVDALEWGARQAPDVQVGGFLHVSGLKYTIDASVTSSVQADDKGVWTGAPTGEYRVKDVQVYNKETQSWEPIDLAASYNLAGYNYTLRDLGDGFAMFDGAVNVLDYVMEDYMVLANYVKSFPVNEQGLHEIPADDARYANVNGEGRIHVCAFEDVSVDSFYYESVKWALNQGITIGATETTFNPGGDLLRAQVVTMLWRDAGQPESTGANPFTDVSKSDFFYEAVLWAVENGITNGISATEFDPYGTTNRAQAVTFLWRYLGEPDAIDYNPFTDVQEDMWYKAPINWAVQYGITNGLIATEFGINANCNRAHMVTFLYRVDFPMEVEPLKTYTFELRSNDPTEELGYVLVEDEGPFVAGQTVQFCADPWYGYLVEFETVPALENPELYYLGAGVYEFVMPACDVVMTAKFVPAQGKSYQINTTCTNGFAIADCDVDADLNDIAKPGEFVQFLILPDEGFCFDEGGFTAKVNGKVWDKCWYLGEIVLDDPELGTIDGIFIYEMVMPEGNVDVTITCSADASPAAAQVRVPVTVR